MTEIAALTTSALQPYLDAMGKDSNANRAVVMKALADSDIFAGYDQLKMSVDDEKLKSTLDLFSYGTVSDYQATPDKYLGLNEAQVSKLRQLTVLSLVQAACQQRQKVVPYAVIQQSLQMATTSGQQDPKQPIRDTEQILSQLLAACVISGKLSQKQQAFLLIHTAGSSLVVRPRDVNPAELPNMILALERLRQKLAESDGFLASQQKAIRAGLQEEKAAVQRAQAKGQAEQPTTASSFGEPMDLEGPRTAAARRQKRSRGGFTNSIQDGAMGASRAFGV